MIDPAHQTRSHQLASARLNAISAALPVIALFAVILGALHLAIGASAATAFWIPLYFTLVYGIWVIAGLVAWWKRPTNLLGAILLVGALTISLAALGNIELPFLAALGNVFGTAVLAVTIHLLLAFPTGRLTEHRSQFIAAAGYVVALVFQAPLYLLPSDRADLIVWASWLQRVSGAAVVLATVAVLARNLRTADHRNRRVLLPLYFYGIFEVIFIPVSANILPYLGADPVGIGAAQLAVIGGIPVVFLTGVLLGRFDSTSEADALSIWLGLTGSTKPAVATALSQALGDASLRVCYWSDENGTFFDSSGRTLAPQQVGPHRRRHDVHIENRLVATIEYDNRMITNPRSIQRTGQILAVAIDRERLLTALLASNEALNLSRIRLVETADSERTRIARDLHDGLQVQLVLLALEAQQIANAPTTPEPTSTDLTQLRQRIDTTAADLRRLVHDILPSAIVERGLTAATEDLVDRINIPATLNSTINDHEIDPACTQTAYLVIAEALTNTTKHSSATRVSVDLTEANGHLLIRVTDNGRGGARPEDGTGLRGLFDRVDALHGTLRITSLDGQGTEISVEIPCES